jgi:hypothetical protein
MANDLEPIDTYNNFYILPSEERIAEMLGIDATCRHGYTTYQVCSQCLEALFSECFAEVENLKNKRRK